MSSAARYMPDMVSGSMPGSTQLNRIIAIAIGGSPPENVDQSPAVCSLRHRRRTSQAAGTLPA